MIKEWIKKIDWKSYFFGVAIGIIAILLAPVLFAKEELPKITKGGFEEFRSNIRRDEMNAPQTEQAASLENNGPVDEDGVKKPKIPQLPNTSS